MSSRAEDSNPGSLALKPVLSYYTVLPHSFLGQSFPSKDTIHTGIEIVYYSDLNQVMEETGATSIPLACLCNFKHFSGQPTTGLHSAGLCVC